MFTSTIDFSTSTSIESCIKELETLRQEYSIWRNHSMDVEVTSSGGFHVVKKYRGTPRAYAVGNLSAGKDGRTYVTGNVDVDETSFIIFVAVSFFAFLAIPFALLSAPTLTGGMEGTFCLIFGLPLALLDIYGYYALLHERTEMTDLIKMTLGG